MADGAYNFLESEMLLGQPIYADGMFFGSEFPAADTDVEGDAMQIRYYSGKSLAQLREEGSLDERGAWQTWPNVIGAAQGTDTDVVQTDFFAYIDTIATRRISGYSTIPGTTIAWASRMSGSLRHSMAPRMA